jgi:hypothetical protein
VYIHDVLSDANYIANMRALIPLREIEVVTYKDQSSTYACLVAMPDPSEPENERNSCTGAFHLEAHMTFGER